MYVCLCNGYRDTDLRQMAREGFTSAQKAYAAMGAGPNCGQCLDRAQKIIDESRYGSTGVAGVTVAAE